MSGIGIQIGLMYSYNNLATAGLNWQGEVVSGWSGNLKPKESNVPNSNLELIDVDYVKFHAISIPLSIRWYPGCERQFVLHGGPRLAIPLSKAKQVCYDSESFDTNGWHDTLKCFHRLSEHFFNTESGKKVGNDLEIKNHFTWDFGFAYKTKFGFIIGMNGIGLELGYDCAKLLV